MTADRKRNSSYAKAGVDIDEMMSALSAAKKMVRKTAVKGVLSHMGSFGGMFAAPGKDKVLVASTDGVGTKLKVAVMADRHGTVGQDLVNHCVNDILVHGAKPLFFLDYVGAAKLKGRVFREVIQGFCKACQENGCALLGGETAEMPGLYPAGEYDLVGTIVGVVDKKGIVTGRTVRPGNIIIGLRSTGLHTNGYSLARKVIFQKAGLKIDDMFPGMNRSVADVLLNVHKSYLKPVTGLMKQIRVHAMAHITGGGFLDNIPRILPQGMSAVVDRSSWKVPPLFQFIQEYGAVRPEEMYRVFNMGIGFVLIVSENSADEAITILREMKCRPVLTGYVKEGKGGVVLTG